MIIITGWRSQIAREFRKLLPVEEAAMRGDATKETLPIAERYLFCQGLLRPTPEGDQTIAEAGEGWWVNCDSIVRECRRILSIRPDARICIIGSESAYRGSYDGVYAASKKMVHEFVESEPVGPNQQLVAISPGVVFDAGMTTRRTDVDYLDQRRVAHPKRRFLASSEVAYVAHALLYGPTTYITGTVVRMHGGLK